MNFKEYQEKASFTAVYPRPGGFNQQISLGEYPELENAVDIIPIMYCALGLSGEAGEVAEQIKKSWRNNMEVTNSRRENVCGELGDVLWYVAQLATELGLDLEEIANNNISKLLSRKEDGKLKHE